MSELTIHTGCQGDNTVLHVEWFNENNVAQHTLVELTIGERDKPRTLYVAVNGVTVGTIVSGEIRRQP